MTIQNVGRGTTRDYTEEEIAALHANGSTSAALNEARRRTGDKGGDVAVRGEGDVGLERQLETNKTDATLWDAGFGLLDVAGMVGIVGVGPAVGAASGAAALIADLAPAIGPFFATQYGLYSMQKTKTETRDAAVRDVMRGAMLLSLELPSGYVDSALPRDVGTGARAPARKISDQIKLSPLGATLQLHCDQGIRAAEDFLATKGKTKEQFFAGAPKLAERYANDAAFKAGFDALVWAKENAPADRAQMLENLRARDARYAAIDVRVSA